MQSAIAASYMAARGDPYYEPLLVFGGWRRVDDLENRTITVWSKDGVAPATSRLLIALEIHETRAT